MTKRLKVSGIVLLAAGAVTVGLIALKQWASHPADGTLRTGTPIPESAETTETQTEVASVTNDYFTTNFPPGFQAKRQTDTPAAPALLQLAASNQHQQLAITVAAMPAGGLADVGSYNLRVKNTTSYQPFTLSDLPPPAVAFQTLDGPPAFVVYWPYGGWYAEIALTSDGGARLDELTDTLAQFLPTWRWR